MDRRTEAIRGIHAYTLLSCSRKSHPLYQDITTSIITATESILYIYGGSKSQNKSIFYYKVLFISIHVTLPIATIKEMWSYVAFESLSQPLKMHCTYILYCNAPNLHIHVAYFILFHMHMSTDTFTRL